MSRNPFSAYFTNSETVDSCFRRNDKLFVRIESENLIIEL
ncbi:Uncharacterized protein dnm_059500 [Desulfonema magnum]|uniref:Uncharacterized protein n=1 Tax=Desulfonema magnum TaxID=45655 RepID=A0A975GQI1_9BACT|nr:Uncharacterized protein dnm_059500 [Desulfonema magnum]